MNRRLFVSLMLVLSLTVSFVYAGGDCEGCKIKFYGFVKFEGFYDNTQVKQGDWLLFAYDDDFAQADQAVFSMNARHTRIGMKLAGPELANGGKVKGLIEMDFAGGFPNSSTAARQPQPRLRHAWVELNYPTWAARFGQDWALIAGPFPNTTSFVVGAGKGNLWMRYPQMKFTMKADPLKLAVSLNRPMAGNIGYNDNTGGDFDMVGDGEMSGMPWIMGRVWYDLDKIATLSLSGHYGMEQINDTVDPLDTLDTAAPHDMTTFSINADAIVKIENIAFTVRGFMGENLNSFFGGVFQGYVRDYTSVTNIASMGGWAQMVYKFDDQWSATIGGGFDDPDDEDLGNGARDKNDWMFANVGFEITKGVKFMLEGEYLKTSYVDTDATDDIEYDSGENLRIQFVSYFKF